MKDVEIAKELKSDIDYNQTQLKNAICNHQNIVLKLNEDPDNVDIQKEIRKAEEEVIFIGLEQKNLLERLREAYKAHQKVLKTSIVKNGIEERRFNLSNALNRARKQNIVIRSSSVTSFSDDSIESPPLNLSPEPQNNPLDPHDVSQADFLNYFCLATHDVYKEMQNKRVERKRRSTANPHFLYGNKGWDFIASGKRKRGAYLVSSISPPNTRQSVKKKAERISPPLSNQLGGSPTNSNDAMNGNNSVDLKPIFDSFPTLPNLPSGLIIERVSPGSSSPDSKSCITCKQSSGVLAICEVCANGFHVSCHNRPFAHTPRQCPRCISKETRTVGSLNVPSGMSVSYITSSEVSDKLIEKRRLEDKRQNLSAELTQLQDRHSKLTISIKNQKVQQENLLNKQQLTEDKITKLLDFIEAIRKPLKVSDNSDSC